MTMESTDRRTVLRGAAVIGAGAALTACGGGGNGSSGGAGDDEPTAGASLGKAADVPVGSGKIFADEKVVVTQPTEGDFRAFSALCTHAGCVVATVTAPTINCSACHKSKYSYEDGSVIKGPATQPLEKLTVTDEGGTLKLG